MLGYVLKWLIIIFLRAFSNKYYKLKDHGMYQCIAVRHPLLFIDEVTIY